MLKARQQNRRMREKRFAFDFSPHADHRPPLCLRGFALQWLMG
jgi:hypothetical protein